MQLRKWKNTILVTSLNGRSIYVIKFQSKKLNKIVYVEQIYIGERIRDIKYHNELNGIILALEEKGELGIITTKKMD